MVWSETLWQAVVGLSLVVGLYLFAFEDVPFWSSAMPWWLLLITYSLGFTGAVLGTVARSARRTPWAWLVGLVGALILTCSHGFLWSARTAMQDTMLACTLYLAIYGYALLRVRGQRWWCLILPACALAVMAYESHEQLAGLHR